MEYEFEPPRELEVKAKPVEPPRTPRKTKGLG
jgi:hypothetical protein